jgi:hypothetical protein
MHEMKRSDWKWMNTNETKCMKWSEVNEAKWLKCNEMKRSEWMKCIKTKWIKTKWRNKIYDMKSINEVDNWNEMHKISKMNKWNDLMIWMNEQMKRRNDINEWNI